jgi:hypothetical protein
MSSHELDLCLVDAIDEVVVHTIHSDSCGDRNSANSVTALKLWGKI